MTTERKISKTYSSRSAAMRAARKACRVALNAPGYQAAEGPDFILHPQGGGAEWRMSRLPHKFELRGPAADANQ